MGKASRRKWNNRIKRINEAEDAGYALKVSLHVRKKEKLFVALKNKGIVYADETA